MPSKVFCAIIVAFSTAATLSIAPALALVGKSESAGRTTRHTVMVLKRQTSSASFCSGVVVAPRTVLTAAHCVAGAAGVAIYVPGNGAPALHAALTVAVHPGYVANAIRRRKRSIDLALVRTATPLPAGLQPIAIAGDRAAGKGTRLRIAGFGLQREGVERSAGTLRSAILVVRAPISSILLWMGSPSRHMAGACTGDSGGPVFTADATTLVAISVWARGKGRRHCGELTQAIRLAPQKAWIESVLARWRTR
ncbi:MAG: S1 family peptidase [Hyphomicrobiales bacterium]|nr:S1 family peptidase [Hyphomicrobiales bacterium]